MNEWGRANFGEPCRECGWSWSTSYDEARAIVAAAPTTFAALLDGADLARRHEGQGWTAVGYVAHVTDNLRIWAERLVAGGPVRPYDADLLGQARCYDDLPVAGVLWSLARAVEGWLVATDLAAAAGTTLEHPERGRITVVDVAATNAHDVHHHQWDVARIRGGASSPRGWR